MCLISASPTSTPGSLLSPSLEAAALWASAPCTQSVLLRSPSSCEALLVPDCGSASPTAASPLSDPMCCSPPTRAPLHAEARARSARGQAGLCTSSIPHSACPGVSRCRAQPPSGNFSGSSDFCRPLLSPCGPVVSPGLGCECWDLSSAARGPGAASRWHTVDGARLLRLNSSH